jgi:hypothetical protein
MFSAQNKKMQITLFDANGKEVAKIIASHITALNHQTWITELKGGYNINHYLTEQLTGMIASDGIVTMQYIDGRFIEVVKI